MLQKSWGYEKLSITKEIDIDSFLLLIQASVYCTNDHPPKLEVLGLKAIPTDVLGKFGSQLSDSNKDLISSSQGGNGAGPSKM